MGIYPNIFKGFIPSQIWSRYKKIKVYFGEDAINDELLIKPSLFEGSMELYYFPDIKDVINKSLDYNSLQGSSYILN